MTPWATPLDTPGAVVVVAPDGSTRASTTRPSAVPMTSGKRQPAGAAARPAPPAPPARPSIAADLATVTLERDREHDLDLDDVPEVRRRVVEPVVNGLFAAHEITSVDVFEEAAPSPPWKHWPTDLAVPKDMWCRVTFFDGEQVQVWLGHQGHADPTDVASRLAETLEDELAESSWGWGQRRESVYTVLPASR